MLLKASTMQATIANLEAADSTEKLTAVLNGYQMGADDAMHVVDALSAVDLEAATSVGELATALQKTANTARESGVDFERLVGYIAAVSENTRQAPELIGNAFRTLFARMQNVKAGKSIDEFGDSLSDVEKVLNRFNVHLRDSQYEFRNMSDVLDDVYSKWKTLSSVEKSQIAVAIAGTRQREVFLSLMSNYDKALKYNEVALNSNGKAQEKYAIYQDSINAKLKELQTIFDDLIYNESNVELFKTVLETAKELLETFVLIGDANENIYGNVNNILGELNKILDVVNKILSIPGIDKIIGLMNPLSQGFTIEKIFGKEAKIDKLTSKINDSSDSLSLLKEEVDRINSKSIKTDADIENLNALKEEIKKTEAEILEYQTQIDKLETNDTRKSDFFGKYGSFVTRSGGPSIDMSIYNQAKEYGKYLSGDKTFSELSTSLDKLEKSFVTVMEAGAEAKNLISNGVLNTTYSINTLVKASEELSDAWDIYNRKVEKSVSNKDNILSAQEQELARLSELASKYNNLQESLEKIDSAYNLASSAISEYNEYGKLSTSTVQSLISSNSKYVDALYVVDDAVHLNIKAIKQLTEAQKQEKIDALKAQISITANTIENIKKRISGYKIESSAISTASDTFTKFANNMWKMTTATQGFSVAAIGAAQAMKAVEYGKLNDAVAKLERLQNELSILEASFSSVEHYSGKASSGIKDVGDAADDTADKLREIQDLFNAYVDAITDQIDKEIDALKKDKDYWEKYYDDKIDAIKEVKEEIDKQTEAEEKLLAIEKAKANLAKANQEVVRIYVRGRGFIYRQNLEAVAAAQEELNILLKEWDNYQKKLELEQQVKNFEDAKNATIKDIEEEIKKLEDLKDKWSESLDIQDAANKYGGLLDDIKKFENMSYQERLDALEKFVDKYNKLTSKLQSGIKKPSSSRKEKDDKDTYAPSSSSKNWDGIVSGGGAWYNPDTYTREEAEKKETERTGKSQARREAGYAKGKLAMLIQLVNNNVISTADAAKQINMSEEEFVEKMKQNQ